MKTGQIQHLILADDLTGANDSGVHFLASSDHVLVVTNPEIGDHLAIEETIIVNTDSRLIPHAEAYALIKSVIDTFSPYRPTVIYKKIDSTFRGNVGSEIDALLDCTPYSVVCLAAANPRNGRTIHHGLCYVNGTPLAQTEIACDPFTPVHSSSVAKIIAQQSTRRIGHLSLEVINSPLESAQAQLQRLLDQGTEIVIADTVHPSDLNRVAKIFSPLGNSVLYVGSAGLFHALQSAERPLPKNRPPLCVTNILIIVGSLMDTTLRQVEALVSKVHPPTVLIKSNDLDGQGSSAVVQSACEQITAGFTASPVVLLQTDRTNSQIVGNAAKVGEVIAAITALIIKETSVDALVVTGGDTAQYVLNRIGEGYLHLVDEIIAGVPVARLKPDQSEQSLLFVTKAGSYGDPGAFVQIIEYLQGDAQHFPEEVREEVSYHADRV